MNNIEAIAQKHTEDRLISCGYQHFSEGGAECNRPNGRADCHLLYISEGVCLVDSDGVTVSAKAGDAVIFPPSVPQHYRYPDGVKSTSYFIHFTGELAASLLLTEGVKDRRVLHIGTSVSLEELFSRLTDEYKMKLPCYEDACLGYLRTIISIIKRKIIFSGTDSTAAVKRIADICRKMHSDTRYDVTVKELAASCHLSESRFSHLFKEIMGKSPMSYLLDLRLNKAKELLEDTELSVLAISEALGFSNQFYFSRQFKKHTALSPTEYRRKT